MTAQHLYYLFQCFFIYAFLGWCTEVAFAAFKERRFVNRGFLNGPICPVYGFGVVAVIHFLTPLRSNLLLLYLGSAILVTAIEWLTGFILEKVFHNKWWDYSNRFLNINGRICLLYSVFWGVLTLFLIKIINPKIDILIAKIKDKISIKKLKLIILIVIIFLAIDCIATCYAQKQFVNRMIVENDIEVENKEKVIENYNKTYNNKVLSDFINTFWNDKKMIRTFPNIKIEDKEYNTVYIDSLLPNIQPYYKKIF